MQVSVGSALGNTRRMKKRSRDRTSSSWLLSGVQKRERRHAHLLCRHTVCNISSRNPFCLSKLFSSHTYLQSKMWVLKDSLALLQWAGCCPEHPLKAIKSDRGRLTWVKENNYWIDRSFLLDFCWRRVGPDILQEDG